MKLSKYNYVIKSEKEILIWNTIKESLMRFTKEYYDNLVNEKFDIFSDDEIRILIKNGILINDNVFELENILNRKKNWKIVILHHIL